MSPQHQSFSRTCRSWHSSSMQFSTLALVMVVSLVATTLNIGKRSGIPLSISQIALGLILGATGFGVLDATDPTFAFLAQIGFALVMFEAGSRVPMTRAALEVLPIALLRVVIVGLVAAVIGLGLGTWLAPESSWVFAVVMTSSSAALVLPLLGPETRRSADGMTTIAPSGSKPSRTRMELIAQIALADALSVILLPLAAASGSEALSRSLGMGALILAALAIYILLRVANAQGRREVVSERSHDRKLALQLKTILVGLFALCALAVSLGLSVMLAVFLMGLVVAALGEPHRVSRQIFALGGGFFGPVFYVWFGAELQMRALAERPDMLLLGALLGLGAVAAHASARLARLPLRDAVLSAGQMGVPVAAVAVSAAAGGDPGVSAAILMGFVVVDVVVTVVATLGDQAKPARPEPSQTTLEETPNS